MDDEQMTAIQTDHRATLRAILCAKIESIRQDAKRGPLHSAQIKMLKMFAKQGFPGAAEILARKPAQKKRKDFAAIVKETPRQEGETCGAWVQRIWNGCEKYETNCPRVITEELLHKYSRHGNTAKEQGRERGKHAQTQARK